MQRRAFLTILLTPFAALAKGDLEPDRPLFPSELEQWKNAPRQRTQSLPSTPLIRAIHQASAKNDPILIRYHGGSHPGSTRPITPREIYEVEGYPHRYLEAWCHETGSHRTFRLDLMELPGPRAGSQSGFAGNPFES